MPRALYRVAGGEHVLVSPTLLRKVRACGYDPRDFPPEAFTVERSGDSYVEVFRCGAGPDQHGPRVAAVGEAVRAAPVAKAPVRRRAELEERRLTREAPKEPTPPMRTVVVPVDHSASQGRRASLRPARPLNPHARPFVPKSEQPLLRTAPTARVEIVPEITRMSAARAWLSQKGGLPASVRTSLALPALVAGGPAMPSPSIRLPLFTTDARGAEARARANHAKRRVAPLLRRPFARQARVLDLPDNGPLFQGPMFGRPPAGVEGAGVHAIRAMERLAELRSALAASQREMQAILAQVATGVGRVDSSDCDLRSPEAGLAERSLPLLVKEVRSGAMTLDEARAAVRSLPRTQRRDAWLILTKAAPPGSLQR